MSRLAALNGWKGSNDFNSKRNAQNYLNKGKMVIGSSCGSSCGAGDDGKETPKPSSCGSACGAGDK